jgi:exopolysaccharide biosynthesis WecB/TagA/CpsF family protein
MRLDLAVSSAESLDVAAARAVHGDRVALAGVHVDRVSRVEAARLLAGFLASGRLHQVVTVNLDFLRIARANESFRATVNGADLAVADGMPLVWASRLVGRPLPERLTGNALVEECCRLSAKTGEKIFLLGAGPGVAERAARAVARQFPGAIVAGTYSPPFRALGAAEDDAIVERVNRSAARILLVALGAPRQDLWIARRRTDLEVRIAMGVGCCLDILAGAVPRAPRWMQRAGLEWLFRFGHEPGRLWRRYFVEDLPIFARLIGESLATGRS